MRSLILASGSPRRREILQNAGFEFDVVPSEYVEDLTLDMPPLELAKHLSAGKAWDVARNHSDSVVLAADTFIAFDGRILGKPDTPEDAWEMLSMLSGMTHSVITGFTVIQYSNIVSRAVETRVTFRELSEGDIEGYIATGEPLDKAGAYAIQGIGEHLVQSIDGDYLNVVGLPLEEVTEVLRQFGVAPDANSHEN